MESIPTSFPAGNLWCEKGPDRPVQNIPDCIFLAFTNGTLVDEAFAKELRRVGNFGLAFSIEGFEEETDMRRGAGTYQAVIRAMDLFKAEGVAFRFSTCYHSKNVAA